MSLTVTTVETAITAIETSGQSFTLDGMTYSKADLNALRQLRKDLQAETERSGGNRPVFRGSGFSTMGYD